MKVSRTELARALAATTDNPFVGGNEDFDSLVHYRKLHWLVRADKFIRAMRWLRDGPRPKGDRSG